jgi:hypothetical protein
MPISQIVTNSIANDAVVTADIANGAVTSAKMASGAALSNLGASQLADANMAPGSVLQVVQASVSTSSDYTSSTPTLRVSLSITPSSTNSRIYLIYTAGDCVNSGGNTGVYGGSWFYRNSTQLIKFTGEVNRLTGSNTFWIAIAGNHIDSPSSTSAITYAVYHANTGTGTWRVGDSSIPSVLTAMEIAG